ncbi:DUF952 domain-containing protein [Rhodococcus sp. G-MC3]|uniref:DUF952 domain-containing protein n=1 Tax=Rhodococcus sp. G-MC3 TaxID=3046209 RepID=UPI0024BAEE1A|nr:DUF952 domain-containing protein [Rhodococcus sp. G-MC3]
MNEDDGVLLHICSAGEWESARRVGEVRPLSFESIGFVHLSSAKQIHLPANRLFAGRTDLLLLVLDPRQLGAPLRWEPGVPGDPESMLFPHLYGPLPLCAVSAVVPYRPGVDGKFSSPEL